MSSTWSTAIANPAQEFTDTPLSLICGQIPEGLQGSLYRNGPGRLTRGKKRVGHWFDGDGAILAVHFGEQSATAAYRYVQTPGYAAETLADRYCYPNYGMTIPGGFWNNIGKLPKNSANTSILPLEDRLLALWEAGLPYALDLETLKTLGPDDLSGLSSGEGYSAHPKIDPETGQIFNFCVKLGSKSTLVLYRSDRTGKIEQRQEIKLSGPCLIHDFVLAGQYLVFLVPPVRIKLLQVLLGFSNFSESMQWRPELGTEVIICDRSSLSVVNRFRIEPRFQWHFSNGYVEPEGAIVIELAQYPDFETNKRLKEIATGHTQTLAPATLQQLRFEPRQGKILSDEPLWSENCEFPVVSEALVGKDWRYSYLVCDRPGSDPRAELFGAIARVDRQGGAVTIADCGEGRYVSEPIFVVNPADYETGWIITVVYDGNCERSEVVIYDSERLGDEPLARLALPQVIPHSFHGKWRSPKS
jgi:carotenoid cleavage dioxygenase-like enzyme